jgi:hypothetical protein
MPIRGETREQKVRRLVNATRIQPGKAARYLVASERKDPSFMKVLVLAQLLAWVILDQRPGQRTKNSSTERGSAIQGRPILVRNALYVGNHALALLLYRQRKLKKQDETTRVLNELLEARGGVGGYAWVRGSYDLYNDARMAERELHYVYLIVSYLCRCKKYGHDTSKFNIETAKEFIAQWAPDGKNTYGVSKIEKIWLQYKNAAPYIFAFYGYLRGLRREVGSPRLVLASLEKFASNEPRLKRLIGRAAYATDILNELARHVRISDFNDIARAEPQLRKFSTMEKDVIDSIDLNARIDLVHTQELVHTQPVRLTIRSGGT